MAKRPIDIARLLGKAGAHLQDGIDDCLSWGLRQARKVGEVQDSAPKKKEKQYLYHGKRIARGILKFLGQTGESYFEEYERLKREEREENED